MHELLDQFHRFALGEPPSAEVLAALETILDDVRPVQGWPPSAIPIITEREIVEAACRGLQPLGLEDDDSAVAAILGWLTPRVDPDIAVDWEKQGIQPR